MAAGTWRRVGLFLSSTFDDMHAERDYLVKRVLPRLQEWCEQRRLHLVDVDLRWGIHEELKVVETCLRAIDACRPLFVCFLGQRFGRITQIEITYALEQGADAFFYLRDAAALNGLPRALLPVYANGHEDDLHRLRELAGERARTYSAWWDGAVGRLTGFRFEDQLLADLQDAIRTTYPDHAIPGGGGETEQQEQYLARVREAPVEREETYAALDAYVDGDQSGLFTLVGPSGLGKTTVLARWLERREEPVIARFVGASDRSTSVDAVLAALVRDATGDEPADPAGLRDGWTGLVRGVVVLDGLNQLDEGLADLDWLPWVLPSGLKVVVSYATDVPGGAELRDRMAAGGDVVLHDLPPLTAAAQRRQVVEGYLSGYFKELEPELMEWLIGTPSAGNPLYLMIVLSELRVFGDYQQLRAQLTTRFGSQPLTAFEEPLRRMENDPPYAALPQQQLVREVFGLLATARTGLSVDELAAIVPGDRRSVEDGIQVCLRQMRPFLARRQGRDDLLHDSFRAAARRRYAGEDWHDRLADYFDALPLGSRRRLTELVYHLLEAGRFERVREVLCDPRFIEAKCAAGLTGDLLADYDAATRRSTLAPLPEFARFVRAESHALARYASTPGFTFQQAANWAASGPVHEAGVGLAHARLQRLNAPPASAGPLLATLEGHAKGVTDAAFVPGRDELVSSSIDGKVIRWDLRSGRRLETVVRLEGGIDSCDVSADGAYLALGCADGRVRVHHLRANTTLVCEGAFAQSPRRCRFLPDGRLLSVGRFGLMTHDPATGRRLHAFEGQLTVSDCAVLPDGRIALACADATVCVYDPATSTVVEELDLDRAEGLAWTCALSPGGSLLIGCGGKLGYSDDVAALGQSSVWNTATWEEVYDLKHAVAATACRFIDDTTVAIGLLDGSLMLYDARTGEPRTSRGAHSSTVRSLRVAGDLLVSASLDKRVRVWTASALLEAEEAPPPGRGRFCAVTGSGAHVWTGTERGFEFDFGHLTLDADGSRSIMRLWLDRDITFGLRMFRRDPATPLTAVRLAWGGQERTAPHRTSPLHGPGEYWLLAASARMFPFEVDLMAALPPRLWSTDDVRWARSADGSAYAVLERDRLRVDDDEYRFDAGPGPVHLPQVAFSLDGDRVVFIAGARLHVYERARRRGEVLLDGAGVVLHAFCSSQDGTRLAVACDDGSLRIVSANGVRRLVGHDGPVVDCAFLGDDVLSLGRDGSLRVWRGDAVVAVLVGRTPLSAFAVSASGDRLVACDTAGEVYLLAPRLDPS